VKMFAFALVPLAFALGTSAESVFTNGPVETGFSRITSGWTNYSTAFNATHDTGSLGGGATVASFYAPAKDVTPTEYSVIVVWDGTGSQRLQFSSFTFQIGIWSSLSNFISAARSPDLRAWSFAAPTGGSTTVPGTTTRGGRPAYELRFTLPAAGLILSNGGMYLIGFAALADTQSSGELFVPTSSYSGPSDVQAGELVTGGWQYLINAGGSTIYSGQLATELLVRPWIEVPCLDIRRSNGMVELRWPAGARDFQLEFSFGLARAAWVPVELDTTEENGWNKLALPATLVQQFFRLKRDVPP
jgi:hypothetical protein